MVKPSTAKPRKEYKAPKDSFQHLHLYNYPHQVSTYSKDPRDRPNSSSTSTWFLCFQLWTFKRKGKGKGYCLAGVPRPAHSLSTSLMQLTLATRAHTSHLLMETKKARSRENQKLKRSEHVSSSSSPTIVSAECFKVFLKFSNNNHNINLQSLT